MTACQSAGVRQADKRTNDSARLCASDRRLHWCAINSRLAHHNEEFAWLDPRLVHGSAAARRVALKLRCLWRASWRKGCGIPEWVHRGEPASTMERLKRNDCRVAGPANVNDAASGNGAAASDRERLNRRSLGCLELIKERADPR